MRYIELKTFTKHSRKTKKGIEELKSFSKDRENDLALGMLKDTIFYETDQNKTNDYFQQFSYENEIHNFVESLIERISFTSDKETGEIESFIFESENDFSEKQLLWACFDLLIKADITINNIKQSRMELLRELMCQKERKL